MSGSDHTGPRTPAEFVAKWQPIQLPERAASHEHFTDLCRLLGQPTPAEHDATGAEFTFEKHVAVTDAASRGAKGEYGFADVWWKGKFGWEYKRKDKYKDLAEAYRELLQYREALGNPPLLVVCDIARTEIHTNFTGTAKQVHIVELDHLAERGSVDLLRRVFTDPNSFCPTVRVEAVTEEIAEKFAAVAQSLHTEGHNPHTAAHFLMKCMFCLFAEDVDLLPQKVFTRMLDQWHDDPQGLRDRMTDLFACMVAGGAFGTAPIPNFNGGLFDDAPALILSPNNIATLQIAARQDWGSVEPAIFGTLFERSLDPDKRSQIGAHYTSRHDILHVVKPVVMAPLRREWDAVKAKVEKQLDRRRKAKTAPTRRKADDRINHFVQDFDHGLASVRILDPACGSGNFLYVAIQQLLDLEKEVITYAARPEIGQAFLPRVRPTQLHGIELNPYAAELARIVIWIGYLQWMRDNGFNPHRDPILEPLEAIEGRDAILDRTHPVMRSPGDWPEADFIIGNPPFLGSKLFRKYELDDDYLQDLYKTYELPNASDLCCYWFEKARLAVKRRPSTRAGLLATQGIRGGANRRVLERIKQTGDIFMAWSDQPWILDGAAVHVSIIGFDDGSETERTLDGKPVKEIHANLAGDIDTGSARHLAENEGIAFMGVTPSGDFHVAVARVREWVGLPNASGAPNGDVLKPWLNAKEITQRRTGTWIIDFGCEVDEVSAAQYEAPFEHVRREVAPARKDYRTGKRGYWCFERPRPEMRRALLSVPRFIATPRVAKHRLFVWLRGPVLADSATFVFARSDDYFLGVLQGSIHTLWALRMGTQLETRPRYTPTTCFETFPLPWPPGQEPEDDPLYRRISAAARALDQQRERWLNPPEWIDPIADTVDCIEDLSDVPEEARPLIRHSLIMAQAAKDQRLKVRTLTNLYNERPTWLRLAHRDLDRAVLAAYAATDPDGDWAEAWAEVWEETGAGQPLPQGHALADRRAEIDPNVLANLLRVNLRRRG